MISWNVIRHFRCQCIRKSITSKRTIRANEGTIRAYQTIRQLEFLTPIHPLTNFENKPKLRGVYSKNNLPKIKDGTFVINLDKFKSIGTHWIALYVIKVIRTKIAKTNIYRLQGYDSIMCEFFVLDLLISS